MELKYGVHYLVIICKKLLIVPYGIEILLSDSYIKYGISLLIVPYGIEIVEPVTALANSIAINRTLWN